MDQSKAGSRPRPVGARPLPLAEAIERLQSPDVLESFSVLTGAPVLAVDCRADAPGPAAAAATNTRLPAAAAVATARTRLAELACPSVAIAAASPTPELTPLLERFDVVVTSEAELTAVLEAIASRPLAAMALVQLLRHGVGLDVHEALIAESLAYSMLQSGPEFAAWLARRPKKSVRKGSGPAVLVHRAAGRLDLTLNRPDRRNAFSAEMRDALVEALQIAVGDPSITEIVLTGRGAAFCSGGDLDEFGTLADPATAHAVRSTRSPARLLAVCADRVRALVHGACVGAGIELPAFAGHVIAQSDAFFQLPEVSMGLVPGAGGTVSIPRRIGRQRTAYLCLSGVRLDVTTALRWGLVDEIVA